jgi:chromosome segregation ATPase
MISASFLVFAGVVLYLAVNGKFSRRLAIPVPVAKPPKKEGDPCAALRAELTKALALVNEKQRRIEELEARNAELERKTQELMDVINRLTLELDKVKGENARLQAALKQALDELVAARRALAECRAKLLAKQVSDEVCKLAPENANLIR